MKTLAVYIIFSLVYFNYAFGFDWKSLHEEADKTNLEKILIETKELPESLEKLYILGLVYLNLYKNNEAYDTFQKILDKDPASIEAKWGLAEILRRQHKLKESQDILEKLIKENPKFSPAYITLAYVYYTYTRFHEAEHIAGLVIRQGRDSTDLTNYTRAFLIFAGANGMIAHYGGPIAKIIHGTQVYPNLKKAQSLMPEFSGVYFGLGAFYFLAPRIIGGDLNKAIEFLKKAIVADKYLADAYVRLGQVYKIKKDENNYQFYLNKALEIDPQNELALDIKSKRCKFVCVAGEGS